MQFTQNLDRNKQQSALNLETTRYLSTYLEKKTDLGERERDEVGLVRRDREAEVNDVASISGSGDSPEVTWNPNRF